MEIWQAILLGLVEGITEYLPVSSTGHLILTAYLFGLDDPTIKSAVDDLLIVVQGGAIFAVVIAYWSRVKSLCSGFFGHDILGRKLFVNLFIAFLPAVFLGAAFDEIIEAHLFSNLPVIAALSIGGVWLVVLGRRWSFESKESPRSSIATLTSRQALIIGLLQCVAMWPGTSRSMMALTGGYFVGLSLLEAAEFAFLLGLPTLTAASCYRLFSNLWTAHQTGGPNLFVELGVVPVICGLVVATLSAFVAVKWMVSFLGRRGLAAFGYYRILLGAVLGCLVLLDLLKITA